MSTNSATNKNRSDDRIKDKQSVKKAQENRDPISGAHGAHPVGTGVGAATGGIAAGAATGAAIGTIAGPIGTAVGASIGVAAGAILGGLAGKAVGESVNPTIEHEYWRTNYTDRPYVRSGEAYEEYENAYQSGWESESRHQDKSFEDVESQLQHDWSAGRGKSKLEWERAKPAIRDAWERARQREINDQPTDD